MQNIDKLKSNENFSFYNSEVIDISKIFKLAIRNKFSILLITLISTTISIISCTFEEPVYKGSFQIIVKDKKNSTNSSDNSLLLLATGLTSDNTKTQEYILKSPSVLKPVFNFAKKEYKERGKKVDTLSYDNWLKNNLKIEFKKGTEILNISFKDKNKSFILDTLNLIKIKYEDYSKRDRLLALKNTKNYLEERKEELEEKYTKSLLTLNKFSIENGLGDIDGFVSLANSKNNNFSFDQLNSNNLNSNNFSNLNNKYETNAGQRYKNQFALLEKYEAQYADLSSRLKPESKYMIDLKLKIDNLRGSLKRPNEILIRYKELVRISTRDGNLLNNIDEQLVKTNLEIKRQLDPWELISNPTVDNVKVSPQTLQSAIKTFLLSSFFSIIFVFFKEKKSGIIFDFDTLKELINCQYLETISNKNKLLSIKLFDTVIKRITFSETANKNNKTSIVDLTYKENQFKENFKEIKKYGSYDFVKITDQEMIEESEKIVFIFTTNQITKNDIRLINKYIVIYSSKLLGWFYLDETSGL